MVNVLISSKMVRASYRHGTTGVIALITTDSGERRILNVYRGVVTIREKAHELDDGARVWWCEEMKSRMSSSSTFTGCSRHCKLKVYTCDPVQRSLPQK